MGVIRYLKGLFAPPPAYAPPRPDEGADKKLGSALLDNLIGVRAMFTDSGDLIIHEVQVCGVPCAVLMCEGMVNTQTFSEMFAEPLTRLEARKAGPDSVLDWVRIQCSARARQKEIHTFGEALPVHDVRLCRAAHRRDRGRFGLRHPGLLRAARSENRRGRPTCAAPARDFPRCCGPTCRCCGGGSNPPT